jgi:hypothetical protein
MNRAGPEGCFQVALVKKQKEGGEGPWWARLHGPAWPQPCTVGSGSSLSFATHAREKQKNDGGGPGTHLRAAEGTAGSWAVWQRGGAASGRPGGVSLLDAMHTNGGSPSGAGGSVPTGRPRRQRRLKMGWWGRRRGSTRSRGPSSSSMISSMPQQALLLLGAPFGWSTPVAATDENGQHEKVR